MTDKLPTGSEEVSVSVIVLPAGSHVSSDEEEKKEDEESGHVDDDEDVDDINHDSEALPKETVRANSPVKRAQRAEIWKHVSCINRHDVPMK
jgi:hypothetical protein